MPDPPEETPSDMPSSNPKKRKAGLDWRTRLLLAGALWIAMSMGIPFYVKASEWRWPIFFAEGVLALAAAFLLPQKQAKREPPVRVPEVAGAPGLIEELASKAIERADKATVGWLTIVGAAHSAAFAAFSSDHFSLAKSPGSNIGLSGALFLLLGIICYAAHHAISSTRQQAIRALQVASKREPAGGYFRFVYKDEDKTPTMAGMLMHLMQGLGYAWVCIGAIFGIVGYLIQALTA